MHEATAVILLNPTEGNPFAPDSTAGVNLVDLETEAQLVLSDEVAGLVADRRDGGTAASRADRREGRSAAEHAADRDHRRGQEP